MNLYQRAYSLLDAPARRNFGRNCVLVVVMAAFEVGGVASVVPFLSVLANPNTIQEQPHLHRLYEALDSESTESFLIFLGGASFALLIASAVMRTVGTYALTHFAQMLRHTVGAKLLDTYLRQPYEFFLERHSGDLAKSILSEVDQLVAQVFVPATNLLSNGVTLLVLTGLVIAVDPATALTVAGALLVSYVLIFFAVRRPLEKMGRLRVRANRGRFEATSEAFSGVKDIKLLGRERAYLSKFEEPSLALARLASKTTVLGQLPRYAIETFGFGGILLLSMSLMTTESGSPDSASAGAGIPLLGLYALAGYRMLPAVQNIYLALSQIRVAMPAVDAVYEDLRHADDLPTIERSAPLGLGRELRVSDIHYRYPNSEHGLAGVNLVVPAGTTVGIVGSTGAGKTTLVDVLLGLLWPQHGRLEVDGLPVDPDNIRAWQATIGYVPQGIFLADATLRENIALGIPSSQIDDARVAECARLAQMDAYIEELPQRYHTEVGERGVRLSGGQRQRIGVARALYNDPDVLVFDEATSALDNLTERALMDAVLSLHGTKTIFMIAHRLTTVRACDQIIVLDRGRVVGVGTYQELVETNQTFQAIAGASDQLPALS